MRVRVFGAVRGAGPQVRESSSSKPIQDAPLGTTLLVGMFRGGPTELVKLDDVDHFRRVFGGLTQQSEAPLCAEDFYEMAEGTGTLYVMGVDDGDSVAAQVKLWSRDVGLSILEQAPPDIASQAFTVKSLSKDRRGGRKNRHSGQVTLSSAITGTGTINLGFSTGPNGSALVKDAWKDAILSFPGDDASAEFKVTANTAAGVFTISGDFTDDVKNGTVGGYLLELDNVHELTLAREALAVVVKDQGLEAKRFNVEAWRDGGFVKAWEGLELDINGSAYWQTVISEDERQWELTPVDAFSGDVNRELSRPANYAEIPAPGGVASGGNSVTFQTVRWQRNDAATSSGFDAFIDTVNDWTDPSEAIPLKLTLTFTAATTFTVAAEHLDTGELFEDLASGTLGSAWTGPNKWIPSFTARAGGTAASAGDILVIYYRPLPANLGQLGALFYPAAATSEGDVRSSYRVRSNTHETITFAPGVDVSGEVTAPGAPTFTSSTAGPYTVANTDTLKYEVGGRSVITLTNSLTGSQTTTALAAELNSQELTRAGAAADKLVEFGVSSDDKLTITALQDFGPAAVLDISDGTLNAIVGYTDDAEATGARPTIGRLEWRQELEGGVDGFASIEDDDYVQALGFSASDPLGELLEANTGLIKLAVPGVTASAVQAAAMLWAYNTNGCFYAEAPTTSQTSEADGIAWHESNLANGEAGGQNYHRALYPSHGKRPNPYGQGQYTSPMVGALLGVEAREANRVGGYHHAPAGTSYRIDRIFTDVYTGKKPLNSEVLNAYGLTEIRRRGSKIYAFGGRIPGDGETPFLHKRLTLSHIGRILLTNTEDLVFMPINARSLFTVRRKLRALFTPWFQTGWFDDSDGPAFEDQVTIRADDTNNPLTSRQAGDLNAGISFEVVNTAERVIFSLGPKGVSESAA